MAVMTVEVPCYVEWVEHDYNVNKTL